MFGMRRGASAATSDGDSSGKLRNPLRVALAVLIAPALLIFGTGCAQKRAPAVAMIPSHHAESHRAAAKVRAYAEVELEDDGKEAQQPPLAMRTDVPDDPTEPYSPNYGRSASTLDDAVEGDGSGRPYAQEAAFGVRLDQQSSFQRSMLR